MTNSGYGLALLILLAAAPAARASETLGLDAYLSQVQAGHQGVRASAEAAKGAGLRSGEAELLLAPTIFASGQLASDAKQPLPPFHWDKVLSDSFNLGVSQLTSFGLQAKLTYSMNYFNYVGLAPAYFEGHPMVELTQSLWKNAFGAETRASQEAFRASALAESYAESFKAKTALSDAETAYWRLALARQNVTVQKDALARGQKLYDWSEKRARNGLGDRSDLLQAEAALEVRKLQLQGAEDEERAASRAFNEQRGIATEAVSESLAELDAATIDRLPVPVRADQRDDVRAAEQAAHAAVANADLSLQRISPTFELFGAFALNSRELAFSSAFSDSFHAGQPTTMVGLRFTAPIDFGLIRDTREGWRKERAAAELTYERKLFEQDRDWQDLNDRLADSRRRLALSRALEAAQGRKLDYEKERLNHGRSTTYQVLLFEQDFAQAQLSRIQAEAEVLNLLARLKLFVDAPAGAPAPGGAS